MTSPTPPITVEEIAAIRELEKEATPGEWLFTSVETPQTYRSFVTSENEEPVCMDPMPTDGNFIVALRNAAPRLLDAAERGIEAERERDEALTALAAKDGTMSPGVMRALGQFYFFLANKAEGVAHPISYKNALALVGKLSTSEARVRELEEVLRPFVAACAKADAHAEEAKRCGMGTVSDSASPGWGIRYGHLKAARSALGEKAE